MNLAVPDDGARVGHRVAIELHGLGADVQALPAVGDLAGLVQNTRCEKGETKNDPELAKKMAAMAEVYVSDAFGAVHRAHASASGANLSAVTVSTGSSSFTPLSAAFFTMSLA